MVIALQTVDIAEDTPAQRAAKLPTDIVMFSLQDLFGYLHAHPTMSGIQRVQAGIALYAIDHEGDRVGFILNDLSDRYRDGEFLLIDNAQLRTLIVYASGERVDHSRLRQMLRQCEQEAAVVRPQIGQTIILLGAFWGHGNTVDRYVTAKRDGVKIGAYVYDIIPITHPEFCEEALARDFSMSIGELALIADFIFTISDYTRDTLTKLFRDNGGREVPISTVPLAHSLTSPKAQAPWPIALGKVARKPYVLYVSTIEGRKNHLYVVNAWQHLIEQGVDVPDLVFVGRKGWRVNGLLDLLDGTHDLGGRVHIVQGLSDAELNSVYAGCLFTVFTSFVEGWGLPVGESLMHGVPCVASRASSIPEVGGEFVDYVDPLNLREGIGVLRRMIEDASYLEARRRHIEQAFVPRTWEDVGRTFVTKTRAAIALDYPVRSIHVTLPEGSKFTVGDLVTMPIRMREYIHSPMRLALVNSFYALEGFGTWMRGGTGEISFATDLAGGKDVLVYVELKVIDAAAGLTMTIAVGDIAAGISRVLVAGSRVLYRVSGRVDAEGVCTVRFTVSDTVSQIDGDTRQLAIGLVAIGYAGAANTEGRQELVEDFTFRDMTPAS